MESPCAFCPRADQISLERDATMFLMCVVKIPGQVPRILTTPTYAAAPGEPIDRLVARIVPGAQAIEQQVRAAVIKEQPCATAAVQPARPDGGGA